MICLWHAILICIENAGNDAVKTSPVYKSCFRYILLKRIFISGQLLIFLCLNSSLKSRTQVASSFALTPLSSMLSYCNFCIYTHPTFKMYSMTMIWYFHHSYIIGDGQHSNRRTYLKILEMTFLAMDFYLVKEKSIYNIFEIWVFSSILI